MDAKPATFSEILSGEKELTIPVFQRYYQWDLPRWKTLWDDLETLTTEEDRQLTHFVGPMVIVSKSYPYDIARYLVIDGQQRLISLSILLCAMRDIAETYEQSALARSIEQYLFFTNTRDQQVYKLRPRTTDREALLCLIQKNLSQADSETLIVKGYEYFKQKITKGINDSESNNPFDYLQTVYDAITRRLILISITLGERDDPAKIFESLNFKAETLNDADLIRNYVLMQVDVNEQDNFNNTKWASFEQLFVINTNQRPNEKELEDFYYRFLISKTTYFAKKRLYSEFTKYVDKYATTNQLDSLVTELKRYARYYNTIMRPEHVRDSELQNLFMRFRYLDVTTGIPFLLSLYDRYERPTNDQLYISKSMLLEYMKSFESFVIRRSIMRERTRGYGLDFATAIEKSSTLDNLHTYFIERGWPKDRDISEAFKTFPLYLRERNKARLILIELERAYGHKEVVDMSDPSRITIEHIMPQTLNESWQEMLGDKYQEIHGKYLDTLGNLTLTGYNSELGNRPFGEKKSEYSRHGSGSHLELNTDILNKRQWTQSEILKRSEELAKTFIKIWPRPE